MLYVWQHALDCGRGTGIFLIVLSSVIIIIRAERVCIWGSVYLDSFGEEDRDLKWVHSIEVPCSRAISVFWNSGLSGKYDFQASENKIRICIKFSPFFNRSFFLVHSTGQVLLPRGKGRNTTSKSLTRCLTSPTPPPPHSHTKDSHSTGITLLLYEWCVGSLTSHRIINIQGIVRRDLRLITFVTWT